MSVKDERREIEVGRGRGVDDAVPRVPWLGG